MKRIAEVTLLAVLPERSFVLVKWPGVFSLSVELHRNGGDFTSE